MTTLTETWEAKKTFKYYRKLKKVFWTLKIMKLKLRPMNALHDLKNYNNLRRISRFKYLTVVYVQSGL